MDSCGGRMCLQAAGGDDRHHTRDRSIAASAFGRFYRYCLPGITDGAPSHRSLSIGSYGSLERALIFDGAALQRFLRIGSIRWLARGRMPMRERMSCRTA